jgi:penicillin-insensitive murein endopeptidase
LLKTPAKDLFAAVKEPTKTPARSIGFYSHGCLAGGEELPITGPSWQAMRVSRNRNWGNPVLVKFIKRFAEDAKERDGWPGLLVGDMSQPRGGPLPFGHASHQIGLDVDIWYEPMPDHELSTKERDDMPMETFLADAGHVNPQMWKPGYVKLLRRAASYPQVARIFVNPAIKKWLCENAGSDRAFLHKIQPIYGHDDHFHVRLACPAGQADCQNQQPLPNDDGCGKSLDHWVAALSKPVPVVHIMPATAVKPQKGKSALLLKQLPPDCRTVLTAAPQGVSQVADKAPKPAIPATP